MTAAWPYPRWIAHRGAGKLAPENTLAAFRLGAAHGFCAFECDVKLSADGLPFLLHDSTLDRTTTGSADGSRFTVNGQTLVLPSAAPRAGALVLGVRPEHLDIHPDGGWPMAVETIEMLGAERLVHGRLGAGSAGKAGTVDASALFTVRIDAMLVPPQVGQTVRLAAAPGHLHWFDATSGLRVGA